MRKDKDLKKLAVLEVIKDKKEILFGNFNNKLTQADKQAAWTEVLQRAQSLQLVGAVTRHGHLQGIIYLVYGNAVHW